MSRRRGLISRCVARCMNSRNQAAGTTIILTTHYLEEAEALCRNMAIINHGKIVTNRSIKELLQVY